MKQIYILLLMALPIYLSGQEMPEPQSENQKKFKSFKLYPNPVYGDEVYLTTNTNETKEVKIFDVFGEVVLTTNLTNSRLNVAPLLPGIYVLQVKEEEETASRKLVVK
ncbi:T9SS type A sorting domain-containing protein [Croceivirga thetidis]|uniref:T9SS type A sorting domain-containing protein n=1 Tax=Croceivirga thetidis TaxID=2721623 RepID=A0ABX1GNT4_9FLAO|nr:T9SS type A sorting domain-containing protein [Croceivirga thetidis]NKI31592.1 T9SS type A sorting domain-containing protein [Croceivirga thetidis]